jgi:hypothetical protein
VVSRLALAGSLAGLVIAILPGTGEAAIGIVRMQTTLTPNPVLFGQALTADLDVIVNTKVADPETFETRARFFPYVLLEAPRRDEERDGSVVRVRYTYRLACDSLACTTGAKRERKIEFPTTLVRYRDLQGHAREVSATWPELRFISRTSTSQFRPQTATEAERGLPTAPLLELPADVSAPSPTYRVAPTTGAIALFAAAFFALLGAAWLARPVVALARSRTGAEPELSPLERALAAVDDSARHVPGSAEHREALALLARELRRVGRSELVQPARRIAWSEEAPTAAGSRELVTEVRAGRDGR